MAGTNDRYDAALLSILQNEGNISNFLQVMFGFLFRRTDFYIVMKGKQDTMGFPPGATDNIILQTHKHFEKMALERDSRKSKQATTTVKEIKPVKETSSAQKETESSQAEKSQPKTKDNLSADSKSVVSSLPLENKLTNSQPTQKTSSLKESNVSENTATKLSTEEETDTEISRQQQVYQADPECYNGAVQDNYSWSQSITDVDVRVNVPTTVRKGNQVTVVINKKHVKVSYKDKDNAPVSVLDSDLTWDIQKEDSMWSLVPGEHVHINLEKREERWWEGLLVDEPKINVRKIDCSRPITDLDDEAQAKIGEMMFNEQQKRLGLPQSHEQKTHDMMKQAWDAEGSPFKGQPFDPSKFSVNPGGVVSFNK